MIRRILRLMVKNGDKCKKDLGLADAIKAEDVIYRQAAELKATEESFDQRMTQLEKKFETNIIRRKEVQDARRTEETAQELEGDHGNRGDCGSDRDSVSGT